jgi:cysteine desulfurase family protein
VQRIYLDNAATSWPKPEAVYQAVDHAMRELGASAGRGGYTEAAEVDRRLARLRRSLATLIGADSPSSIVFTSGGTEGLNLAIHGLLQSGDHAITTTLEHNSVLRPLVQLRDSGQIALTILSPAANGQVDPQAIRIALRPTTRLIALTHASNVTGTIQPLADVGAVAEEHPRALLLVDACQTAGHEPIDVRTQQVDLLATSGHKGLLGPLGTGFLYVGPRAQEDLRATRQGGTGTQSLELSQPRELPSRLESGSLNVPGLLGLQAGLDFITHAGLEAVARRERELIARLLSGLAALPHVTVLGPSDPSRRAPLVSFRVRDLDCHDVSALLDSTFRIQLRSGLHCAPLVLGEDAMTEEAGSVRASVGPFNTADDIDALLAALEQLTPAEAM